MPSDSWRSTETRFALSMMTYKVILWYIIQQTDILRGVGEGVGDGEGGGGVHNIVNNKIIH